MIVQPMHGERQALPKMSQDESELGIRVKYTREDNPQEVTARVDGESPTGPSKLLVALEIGFHRVCMGQRGMKIYRHAE
jgi:hypothetical protein